MCMRPYDPQPFPELPLPCALPPDWDNQELRPLHRLAAIAGTSATPSNIGLCGSRYAGKRPFGICLDGHLAISLFGVNRSGKSYFLGVLMEMALQQARGLCMVKQPKCVIAFHGHPRATYDPDLLHCILPNHKSGEVEELVRDIRALPRGILDVLLLTPLSQVARMRRRHPHIQVQPIEFALSVLQVDDLRRLLGLSESQQPLYAQQVEALLRTLSTSSEPLTFPRLIEGVKGLRLCAGARRLLLERLKLVRPQINDGHNLRDHLKPGRLIIVDVRDSWTNQDQQMLLTQVVCSVLALHPDQRRRDACPLMLAFDEAHKYTEHRPMRRLIESAVRERRHLHVTVALASQDPLSLPDEILPLLDIVGVFKHGSQAWNSHLGKHLVAFKDLKASDTDKMPIGTMVMWAKEWWVMDQDNYEQSELVGQLIVVKTRPRYSFHASTK